MSCPERLLSIACTVIFALLIVAGCGDDSTSPPKESSKLKGTVLDAAGDPMSGASINIHYCFTEDIPQLEIDACESGKNPTRVATGDKIATNAIRPNPCRGTTEIAFENPQAQHVHLFLRDKDDVVVRDLHDEQLPAGYHGQIWDGADNTAEPLPDGIYKAFVTFGTGEAAATSEIGDAFLYRGSPRQYADVTLATSDEQGRFEIPLSGLPTGESITAVNENGESLGTATLSTSVIVYAHESAEVYASESVDLGDLTGSVQVEIRMP